MCPDFSNDFIPGRDASNTEGSFAISATKNTLDEDYDYLFLVTLSSSTYYRCKQTIAHSLRVERNEGFDWTVNQLQLGLPLISSTVTSVQIDYMRVDMNLGSEWIVSSDMS